MVRNMQRVTMGRASLPGGGSTVTQEGLTVLVELRLLLPG